mmetsp:Transcript_77194/g.149058  ORF Transcript_77194/g.149058 Transcript_77194/m.149058 type:complete len:95 (-) Transcript_77194:240-524(-)
MNKPHLEATSLCVMLQGISIKASAAAMEASCRHTKFNGSNPTGCAVLPSSECASIRVARGSITTFCGLLHLAAPMFDQACYEIIDIKLHCELIN